MHSGWHHWRMAVLAILLILAARPLTAQAPTSDAEQQWQELNQQAFQKYESGDYEGALVLAEQAFGFSRRAFGDRDHRTLTSLTSIGFLYLSQGRYDEAEPLLRQALQASREVLGPHHPDTLQNLNNLAGLYKDEGRYGDAEPMYRDALQACRQVLGPRHPQTLGGLVNLALLYQAQGRYDGGCSPVSRSGCRAPRDRDRSGCPSANVPQPRCGPPRARWTCVSLPAPVAVPGPAAANRPVEPTVRVDRAPQ